MITEFSWWKNEHVSQTQTRNRPPKRSNHIKDQIAQLREEKGERKKLIIIINPNLNGHHPINTIIITYRSITKILPLLLLQIISFIFLFNNNIVLLKK